MMKNIELSAPKELTNVILNAVLDNEAKALIESLCSTDRSRYFQDDFTPKMQASGTLYARNLLSESLNSKKANIVVVKSGDIFI
jgi:hypothetical protein